MTPKHPTGTDGRPWVIFDSLKPPRVKDHYAHWDQPPPAPSPRCEWWLHQIHNGWRPPRRITIEGYDGACQWYGVWMWEYLNRIYPELRDHLNQPPRRAATVRS